MQQKRGLFGWQIDSAKRPLAEAQALRYNQFLVIWSVTLLYQQQAGFLTERSSPTAAFPGKMPSDRRRTRHGCGFPYHSDEIVRDLHPLPFYPLRRAKHGQRHLLFSIQLGAV